MFLGKSITTSVPSISIKFHANAEQIEELYGSEDEQKCEINEKKLTAATREKGSNSTGDFIHNLLFLPSNITHFSINWEFIFSALLLRP